MNTQGNKPTSWYSDVLSNVISQRKWQSPDCSECLEPNRAKQLVPLSWDRQFLTCKRAFFQQTSSAFNKIGFFSPLYTYKDEKAQPVEGRQSSQQGSHELPSTATPALTRSRGVHALGGGTNWSITELTKEVKEIHITLSEKDHLLAASVTACTQPSEIILHNFYLLFLPYLIKNTFIHPVSLNYLLPRKGQFRLTFQFESTEIYLWSARAKANQWKKVSKSEGKAPQCCLFSLLTNPIYLKHVQKFRTTHKVGLSWCWWISKEQWMVLQYVKDILGDWYDLPKPALVNWSQESQGPSCSTKPHQAVWVLLHPAERLGLLMFGLVQGFRNLKEFLRCFFQQEFSLQRKRRESNLHDATWLFVWT